MAVKKDGAIRLSPSSLNLFLECPRCFYLEQKEGVKRPRGPFPSLPGGMDLLIKKYFDRYRMRGSMPPEIKGKVEGELFPDIEVLEKWRNWRTGLRHDDTELGASLVGALDDCLIHENRYIPLDYKTRGFDVKENGVNYYQNQLDCYAFLLDRNDLPSAGYAYLLYYIPREVNEGGAVTFSVEPYKVATNSSRAGKTFRDAVALLRGPLPEEGHSVCEFCRWGASESN